MTLVLGATRAAANSPAAGAPLLPAAAARVGLAVAALTAPAGSAAIADPAITNPGGMESRRAVGARLQIHGDPGLTYRADGLPAGLKISSSGLISGAGRKPGTSTVTVTGTSAAGVATTTTFVWTVS